MTDLNRGSNQPLVSVVLNSYNTDHFISEQIQSILAQTYTNLELIICDDCSTDRTAEIVGEYMRKDPRVKWLQNERNLGSDGIARAMSLTLEKGFKLCRGEFIATSDADDYWLPGKIQMQVDYMLANAQVGLVFTDSIVTDQKLSKKLGSFQKRLGNTSRGGFIPIDSLLKRNILPGHVVLFRRKLLSKILPLFSDYGYDIGIGCALDSSLGYISEPTVLYRQHPGNIVSAEVRNTLYYLKRLNSSDFLSHYFEDMSTQMANYKLLLLRGPNESSRKALEDKIANMTALLSIMQALTFSEFVSRLISGARTILGSNQKYHLKQWAFLAFSWGGIRKLKLNSPPA